MALASKVVLVADLKGPKGDRGLQGPSWNKGLLPNGTNFSTFRTPGLWIVPSVAAAETMYNMPVVYPGIFIVSADDASSVLCRQEFSTYSPVNDPYMAATYKRLSTGSSTFDSWTREPVDFGNAREGEDLDLLPEGKIGCPAPNHLTIVNAPVGVGPGFVETKTVVGFPVMKVQFWYEYGGRIFARNSNSFTTYGGWNDLTGGGSGGSPDYSVANPFANEQRKQWFVRRRGGFVGTGGKAVVAIRVDHGAVNMRDLILEQLNSRNLPFGMCLNPGSNRMAMAENAGVTWSDYQNWCAVKGMEVWNHGMSHGDATTTAGLVKEIVESRELLEANIPNAVCEGWMVPGVGGTNYGGQSSTNEVGSFFDYEAGRIILSSHAVASGHGASAVRPQTGMIIDGQAHLGLDSVTNSTNTLNTIRNAQDVGGAVQLFIHPSLVNTPGYTTPAVLNQVWDFLASERDAGRLIILSPSGLLLADPSHTRRNSVIRFGDFQTRSGRTWTSEWSDTTGWTVNGSGVSTSTGGILSQEINQLGLKDKRGIVYEVVAEVTSTAGSTARIGSTSLTGGTKDYTVSAGQTRTIRKLVMPPQNSTSAFYVAVGRAGGGDLTIKNVAMQPV